MYYNCDECNVCQCNEFYSNLYLEIIDSDFSRISLPLFTFSHLIWYKKQSTRLTLLLPDTRLRGSWFHIRARQRHGNFFFFLKCTIFCSGSESVNGSQTLEERDFVYCEISVFVLFLFRVLFYTFTDTTSGSFICKHELRKAGFPLSIWIIGEFTHSDFFRRNWVSHRFD